MNYKWKKEDLKIAVTDALATARLSNLLRRMCSNGQAFKPENEQEKSKIKRNVKI